MKRMKIGRVACVLACVAGSAAQGQNTQVVFEASRDRGLTWSSRVEAQPGDEVLVHIRIRFINASATLINGLAGITFQPRLTNWDPLSDVRLPFSTPDGSAVPREQPDALGRVAPFASAGMGSGSAAGLLTSHVDGGNTLRFAGANAVNATTNLAWGIASGQVPRNLANPPSSFRSEADIVVFRYGVRLGGEVARDLIATVNLAEILQQRASWYRSFDGVLAPVRPEDIVVGTIHYVPAPISLMSMLALPLISSRRRRTLS